MRSLVLRGILRFAFLVALPFFFVFPAFGVETWSTEVGPYPVSISLEWPAPHRAHVVAQITIPAARDRVWEVLTDYDHLEEFIPSLNESKVLHKEGDELLLFQEGGIWFPFYRLKVNVTFRVKEKPKEEIDFQAVSGDFLLHQGSWRLEEMETGTKVTYEVTCEPSFWIPRWVLSHVQRQTLKSTFRSVIQRCLE